MLIPRWLPALLVVFAPACLLNEIQHITPPTLQLRGVELRSVSLDGAKLTATFIADNPNSIWVTIAESTAVFTLDGHRMFEATTGNNVSLPANARADVLINVDVPYKAVKLLIATSDTRDRAPYHVDAIVHATTPFGELGVPVAFDGLLPLPRLPEVRFVGLRIDSLGPTDAHLAALLSVHNQNLFALPSPVIDGNLLDGDHVIAPVVLKKGPDLAPRQSTEIAVPFDLNLLSGGLTLVDAIKSQRVTFRFLGHVKISGHDFPIDAAAALR